MPKFFSIKKLFNQIIGVLDSSIPNFIKIGRMDHFLFDSEDLKGHGKPKPQILISSRKYHLT